MSKYNLIDLTVNGQKLTIIDYETYDLIRHIKPESDSCYMIPFTRYYLYENALTLGLLVKLSGLEELGEVDIACDMRAIKNDKEALNRANREGCLPVTFYPKRGSGEPVRWVFWSELKKMAFENIRNAIRAKGLRGYNTHNKSSRKATPKTKFVCPEKMF